MILKVFTKCDCPNCPPAKVLVRQLKAKSFPPKAGPPLVEKLKIQEYDTSTVDGLAEASFYSVMATPSLILCDDNGKEIRSWRGNVPPLGEILEKAK